jgi:hypothetical protein
MLLTVGTETRVEFMTGAIAKIMLDERTVLSNQLIREIQVMHKVKTGVFPRAFMLYVDTTVGEHRTQSLFRKLVRMAQQEMPVAVIVDALPEFMVMNLPESCRFFFDTVSAVDWLRSTDAVDKASLN